MRHVKRTAEEKLAILREIEATGNRSATCLRLEISPRLALEWKRRYDELGVAGLERKNKAKPRGRRIPRIRKPKYVKKYVRYRPYPDFWLDQDQAVLIRNLKRGQHKVGQRGKFYNFDVAMEGWTIRKFTYDHGTGIVKGFVQRHNWGKTPIVEPRDGWAKRVAGRILEKIIPDLNAQGAG